MTTELEAFGLPISTEAPEIRAELVAALESSIEGYVVLPTSFTAHLLGAISVVDAETRDALRTRMRTELIDLLGALHRRPRLEGSPAYGRLTITALDDLGHVADGPIALSIGDVPMETTGDLIIPPGSTSAEVEIVAVEPGSAPNGATGEVDMPVFDWLAEANYAVLAAPLSNGVDPETDEEYWSGLLEMVGAYSKAPLLPRVYSILARQHPAVEFAWTIPNYNAATDTAGVTHHVTTVLCGHDGRALPPPVVEAVRALIDPYLIDNVRWHAIGPTLVPIPVAVEVEPRAGWSPALVKAAVAGLLARELAPANHATPRYGDAANPMPAPRVHKNDLVARIDALDEVEVVLNVEINGVARGDMISLSARELTTPGAITVTVTSP